MNSPKVSASIFGTRASFVGIFMLCVTASYSIVYSNVQNVSSLDAEGLLDAQIYLAMYKGETVQRYEHCRILTPFLAKVLPDIPKRLFDERRKISDFWMAKIKFGVVNFCFLAATGMLFFYFLKDLGYASWESLVGCFLFYSARPVMQCAGLPMVEASAYFFLILCFYAIISQDVLLFFIGFSAGLFAKESVLLVIPAILLSGIPCKSKMLFAAIPAITLYSFFRAGSVPYEPFVAMNIFSTIQYQFSDNLLHFNKLLDLFSSFGLLWLPVLLAWTGRKLPWPLERWKWLILIMLLITLFFGLNLGRALFMVFPIVIPLALFGLRDLFPKGDAKTQ